MKKRNVCLILSLVLTICITTSCGTTSSDDMNANADDVITGMGATSEIVTTASADASTKLLETTTNSTIEGKDSSKKITDKNDDEEVIYDADAEIDISPNTDNYENCLFKNGLLCVTDQYTRKYGYINPDGLLAIPLKFDVAMDFAPDGLAVVGVGEIDKEKYGFINEIGLYEIEPQFDFVSNFDNNGLAIAGNFEDGMLKYGYINKNGEYEIAPRFYTFISSTPIQMLASMGLNTLSNFKFSENGLAVATVDKNLLDSKFGYIDKNGDFVIEPIYDYAKPFSYGYAVVGIETDNKTKYGIIDENGKYLIEPEFHNISSFDKNGLAIVTIKETNNDENNDIYTNNLYIFNTYKYGLVNKQGKYVIKPELYYISDFDENGYAIAAVFEEEDEVKYGFINTKGDFIIKPIFTDLGEFSENGLAFASIGESSEQKYGFINKKGEYVIEPIYETASSFSNGLAAVRINENVGYINEEGNYVIEPTLSIGRRMSKCGIAIAATSPHGGAKLGYIDINGNFIVEPVFIDADPFYDDGYGIGYWSDPERWSPFDNAYEFAIVNSYGDLINIGSLRPWKWRAW